nr:zinc finger, CCHC-type [Tanacetum cinerariifolium]
MLMVRETGLRTIPKTKVDTIVWWIDSGATTHVCKDCCWFKTYEPVEDEFVLYMGDDHFAPVYGKRSVVLEFSSGKSITLFNVLYVPKLRKNLISGPVLNKYGYKQVYESDKYILSECGVFVGFGYYNNGHMHYKRMLEMSKDDLIPAIDENPEKCTTSPYTPPKNSVVERKNRALKEMVNSIFSYSGLIEGSRDQFGSQFGSQYSYCYSIKEDPRTFDEVMQSRDAAFWKEVIDDEIGSIMENNTWVLSDLPPGCKPLGFRQKEGIDYFDTYAPVAHTTTIRLLLGLAAIQNLVIYQMDVKTTFLNGDLDEEVYMKQPEGFVMPINEHEVCKLVKSLYGLKQAPKKWHQKFDEVVLSSGFHLNQSDKCVYSKFNDFDKGVIICLYVDDMLMFGTDQNQVDKTKKFLSSRFSMIDIGQADVILCIKIKHENKEIVITQSHYIEKKLKKFNREDCSMMSTDIC